MNGLQSRCDQFLMAVRLCSAGIRRQEWHDWRQVPERSLFDHWAFDPEADFWEPEDDFIEMIVPSVQHWIWRVLRSHVGGAEAVVTALTVYHSLASVVDLYGSDIADPVAFARTGYADLLDALAPLHPEMHEWVDYDLKVEFTHMPDANEHLGALRNVEVEFWEDYHSGSMVRRFIP